MGSVTNPNAPLYMPEGGLQMSVNDSVTHYINAGVPKSKIMVGLPLYAHTWYAPGLTGSAWQKFGLETQIQGECCGPFASTGGAKPGQGCQLCGSMMYSEILAGNPETWDDEQTQSTIAYFTKDGEDGGYTAAGTWLSYNDLKSAQAFVQYEKEMGLAGLFIYSTDMDTNSGGSYTYYLMNASLPLWLCLYPQPPLLFLLLPRALADLLPLASPLAPLLPLRPSRLALVFAVHCALNKPKNMQRRPSI